MLFSLPKRKKVKNMLKRQLNIMKGIHLFSSLSFFYLYHLSEITKFVANKMIVRGWLMQLIIKLLHWVFSFL